MLCETGELFRQQIVKNMNTNEKQLKKLIENIVSDMMQDPDVYTLIDNIKEHMSRMKEEDPRAYRDWELRIQNLHDGLEKDLKQAIRWNSFPK
jgi:GH25 family lysozyme M1 (1,4-beta-N-acetylmuramidase)